MAKARENEEGELVFPIKKISADRRTGAKHFGEKLTVVIQAVLFIALYAVFALCFKWFRYFSIIVSAVMAIGVLFIEKDAQCKISWLIIFVVSFGLGYILYILADKRVCFGRPMRKFEQIREDTKECVKGAEEIEASDEVKANIDYLDKVGGYAAYTGTKADYYSEGSKVFDDVLSEIAKAQDFVFLEYFMVADGSLLDDFIEVLRDRCAAGVECRLLYDNVGSGNTLSKASKSRLEDAGVELETFSKLVGPINFGMNYRDHRKIAVIDGKVGFVAGCNLTDNCVNRVLMKGTWKDAGIRMEGSAVDGLSLCFMRQWVLATQKELDYSRYLGRYETFDSSSVVIPYAGGPEMGTALCRGVYSKVVDGAKERLYMMSPYLVPDKKLLKKMIQKARDGVDVRMVLPAVPDYEYIHKVSRFNAEKLIKAGAKVYYMEGNFVHAKVMLTENCVTIGSINLDMRAFFEELDNGVYTNDEKVMEDAMADFRHIFACNECARVVAHSLWDRTKTLCCRIISPLM